MKKRPSFKIRDLKEILGILVLTALFLPFQNCANQLEFAVQQSGVHNILVYGDSDEDQELLRQKLAGAEPPTISHIFKQWSRFSGNSLYQKPSDIIPNPDTANCFTSLDENGDWIKGQTRPGSNSFYQPGTETACIVDEAFSSASWSYLAATNSLKAAINADRFTGFLSGVSVDRYENQAILSSDHVDDDTMGLVIAVLRDTTGTTHILSANRTHGGNSPSLGWGIVYRKYFMDSEGVVKTSAKVLFNKDIGGISKNDKDLGWKDIAGVNGWKGKRTLIRIERNRDLIKAYTSVWSEDPTETIAIAPESEISFNLADPSLGLEVFRGPQKYGYGLHSQYGATFSDIKYKSTLDVDKIYDLKNNKVYVLVNDGSGRFELAPNLTPKKDLGINSYLVNPETQKVFFIWYNGHYEEIDGDIPPEVSAHNLSH